MRKHFLAVFLITLSIGVLAQSNLSTTNKKAIKLYEDALNHAKRFRFGEAIDNLELAIRKDPSFIEAYMSLGSIQKKQGNYSAAVRSFEDAMVTEPGYPGLKRYYYLIGSTYFEMEEYKKSEGYLKAYLEAGLDLKQAVIDEVEQMIKNATFARYAIEDPVDFHPEPLSSVVNRFPIQYFPVLTVDENQIIFTARAGTSPGFDENIFVSRRDTAGEWQAPKLISPQISREGINEGACTISADGKVLVYTICKDRRGLGSCDLYISRKTGDKWSYPINMQAPVNSKSWESQPALSADGRTLYFVSDRSGGIGKLDIWVTKQGDDGKWSEPQNLGPTINTKLDDITPSIHPNNLTLYFSSEGHPGFGGFDLFITEKIAGGWEDPRNMGYPLNNTDDQVSLFVTADGKTGYFSHEEEKNFQYSSLLYRFDIPVEDRVKIASIYLVGKVTDEETHEPLGANIKLYNLDNSEESYNIVSDSINGEYYMVLNEGGNYGLYASRKGYIYKEITFDLNDPEHVLSKDTVNIALERIKTGKKGILENIFFDFDKYEIKNESKPELNTFISFLLENRNVRVEIQGHTDNQGSESYNQNLSAKRAESVFNYLVSKGIDKGRLLYKGLGSKQPIEDNSTELGRSKNRRIEFIIR